MSRKISYQALTLLTTLILEKYGYSKKEAELTAWVLVEADTRGVPSHGVSRLAFYRMNRDKGFSKPGANPSIIWETPVSLVVDGHDGVGGYVSDFAVEQTIAKAKKMGTAFCAVKNSNHYGMAGLWAEKIGQQDMVGMAFTNTRTCGIPTFGRERLLGTNPIAIAIPEAEGKMFLLDMATTTVAHGKIEVYDRRKKPMPLGWAVDENGKGTTDASTFERMFLSTDQYGGHLFLGGEGEENGGHKGYGLGLLVDLLCAGLSMGAFSLNTFKPGQGSGIAHFFGAFRLDLFGKTEDIRAHIAEILRTVRESEVAEGNKRIYIHGEKEMEARALALERGIDVDDATCGLLQKLVDEFSLPSISWD